MLVEALIGSGKSNRTPKLLARFHFACHTIGSSEKLLRILHVAVEYKLADLCRAYYDAVYLYLVNYNCALCVKAINQKTWISQTGLSESEVISAYDADASKLIFQMFKSEIACGNIFEF